MRHLHGLLVIDKPRGWTSHDVVSWIRRRLRETRVGHGGTLDPAAEGILLVAVGQAARLTSFLQEAGKQYLAHIVLGIVSTTDDLEGEALLAGQSCSQPPRAAVEEALRRFEGEIEQVPPAFSAIKVAGKPLYRRTRAGEAVTAAPRRVVIYRLELLHYAYPDVLVSVDCGKGVYIRSLARDLGTALGTGAYLHGLIRTRVGPFNLADAWTLETLDRWLSVDTWRLIAYHPDAAVSEHAALILGPAQTEAWYHGAPVRRPGAFSDQRLARVYALDGRWLGLARYEQARELWKPALVIPNRPE